MKTEYKKFQELTKEEKLKLFEAWIDGQVIEGPSSSGGWERIYHPNWYSLDRYRIKPTKPSINWDHVHPDYNWLADGVGGNLFQSKPDFRNDHWFCTNGNVRGADAFTSYTRGTCAPEDSLVCRPGFEEKE